jgi:hypothetical protein
MKLRIPRLREERRYRLFIADAEDAPPDRWFGSLKAALRAFAELEEPVKRLAWIIEYQEEPRFGGIPLARDIVHMRYGERTEDSEAGR